MAGWEKRQSCSRRGSAVGGDKIGRDERAFMSRRRQAALLDQVCSRWDERGEKVTEAMLLAHRKNKHSRGLLLKTQFLTSGNTTSPTTHRYSFIMSQP